MVAVVTAIFSARPHLPDQRHDKTTFFVHKVPPFCAAEFPK
jgi:hypothetical protein